ncbi:MAG: DUF1800 domain-containing protein [Rubrivivax sp.]|nr:DUF1800 domain-containing protein [Rubrivivax sp.]
MNDAPTLSPRAPASTDRSGALASALAATALAACGGGGEGDDGGQGGSSAALPGAMLAFTQARPMPQRLMAITATTTPPPVPTPTQLFDWAERVHGQYFPGHQTDLESPPYVYRYYPQTQNYVGVASGRVYILGPVSSGSDVLGDVGAIADYGAAVFATRYAFSDAEAARFLGQATLGCTDADIAAVRTLGFEAWLAQEMARPVSTSNWDYLVGLGLYDDPEARRVAIAVDAQIWQRLLSAPDALRQRMALTLSEILVVGLDGIAGPYKQFQLAAWWDLLATHAFGNFRTLLEAVTLNAAMGRYLNTAGNQKEDAASGRLPDENYAREVMQLFSIGLHVLEPDGSVKTDAAGRAIETYTQDEVSQLARVFTGWNLALARGDTSPEFARRPMVLTPALHSTLEASFLGTTVPAGTDGVTALKMALDTLAAHPNVGPFMGRQLIQRLVTSNPSPAYVSRVAAVWADNGAGVRGDLGAVLRAILLDDEARGPVALASTSGGKLREPMLRLIQWFRSFKGRSVSGAWNVGNTSDAARALGQSPLRSSSVFNFFRPGYVPPGTGIAAARLVAPEFQIATETSVAGYLNAMQAFVANAHRDLRVDYADELVLAGDAAALVERIARLLSAGQLTRSTQATIVDAVQSLPASGDDGRAARVHTAVLLVMASLDYLVQK